MKENLIPTNYHNIRDLVERHDESGERIPFSISYACMNGGIVDIKEKSVVCIGVDPRHRTRTLKFTGTKNKEGKCEIRTVHDCLILRINNCRIFIK